jgi:hypothetical protein
MLNGDGSEAGGTMRPQGAAPTRLRQSGTAAKLTPFYA